MDKLEFYLIKISQIFGYNKYDDSFFDYLKSISIPNTTKCGKEIKEGEGGWKCQDCEFSTLTIYCKECFIKEKHIGHKIFYNSTVNGFCDCGDKSILKKEGFCDKHKGDYDNMNDLMKFIKKNIPEKFISLINFILNKICLLFIDKIKFVNKKIDDELFKMIDSLELFCNKLYKSNFGLFYLVTLKFTENFPYKTNHKCFYYDENKNLITFIKKDKYSKHNCICHFLQIIFYLLMKRETKQNSISFINLFLQTYKNKIITSLCFLNCFTQLFNNDNFDSLRNMQFQLIDGNVSLLLFKGNNILFLQSLLEDTFTSCQNFIKCKKYLSLSYMITGFYEIIKYLPNDSVIEKMNSNYKLIKIIFNTFNLVNNIINFDNKIEYDKFQYDGYISELIEAEHYCLLTIICLIHIIDFNNTEEINFIFNIIIEKLFEFKDYKEYERKKKFTPFLFNIRCYSIFLNRFCFDYSIKNGCDLLDSFNHFQQIYPKSKKLNIFLFEELISCFGFTISHLYSYFKYFGEEMFYYYEDYMNNSNPFIKCDISLMKFLLTLPEIKKKFTLDSIVSLSDIDETNKVFNELSKENFLKDISTYQVNFKYINSVIEFLYLIIRDSLSMENIAFFNTSFKWKLKDLIYEQLYQKEKEKFNTLVKNEIIHFILGKKNLVKRDDCVDFLKDIFNNNYIELVDEILKNNCEKISLSNALINFSLNKDILKSIDIDYIINSKQRTNAIEYITNFQSKNNNLMNINILEPLQIKEKLMKSVYKTFLNEKYLGGLVDFYNFIYLNKEKTPLLKTVFHFNITKILYFAQKLCSTQIIDEDLKDKIIKKLNLIQDKEFFEIIKEKKEENKEEPNNKNNKKINVKEKMKQKFEKKNKLISIKYKVNNIIIEDQNQNEEETCVYCRQPLLKDPTNLGYYGKICYYFSDYLTDIMRKKPEKERKKRSKFVSCNHKIHIKCFNEFILLSIDNDNYDNIYNKEFLCPLCKKLSNIILFDFGKIVKDINYNDITKGINYGKDEINIEKFYKKDKYKYQTLINSNIQTFESYCSKLLNKQILIKDINSDKNLEKDTFNSIVNNFEEFTTYYTIANNKDEQIDIWKNILYNIKILFQYKIVNIFSDILKWINFFKFDNTKNLEELFTNNLIPDIINKFIIISIIFFEVNEENKKKIKSFFEDRILPYLMSISFIKSNNNNFYDFLVKNKTEEEKALELYKLKYKICFLLLDEKEENIEINVSYDKLFSFIKSNNNFINLFKNSKNNSIKEQNLQIPELNLMELPEKGIDFLNRKNANCIYCKKKNLYSCYCLLCGNQFCNSKNCFVEDQSSEQKKEYSFIYHSIKCCGGNGIFLDTYNVEIVYILDRRFISSGIYIYLNNFGEPMKEKYIGDEYILNKNELNKAINKYIDLTFRKNSAKIYYGQYNDQNDNEYE